MRSSASVVRCCASSFEVGAGALSWCQSVCRQVEETGTDPRFRAVRPCPGDCTAGRRFSRETADARRRIAKSRRRPATTRGKHCHAWWHSRSGARRSNQRSMNAAFDAAGAPVEAQRTPMPELVMPQTGSAPAAAPPGPAPFPDMVWIPGGTFQMGSNDHYPEERPVHRVTVDGFWMDRTPVTVAQFQPFVAATRPRHVRGDSAEPGRLPGRQEGTAASRLARVRQAAESRGSRRLSQLVEIRARRRLAASARAQLDHQGPRRSSGHARDVRRRGGLRVLGRQVASDRSRVGVCRARRARRRRVRLGQRAQG